MNNITVSLGFRGDAVRSHIEDQMNSVPENQWDGSNWLELKSAALEVAYQYAAVQAVGQFLAGKLAREVPNIEREEITCPLQTEDHYQAWKVERLAEVKSVVEEQKRLVRELPLEHRRRCASSITELLADLHQVGLQQETALDLVDEIMPAKRLLQHRLATVAERSVFTQATPTTALAVVEDRVFTAYKPLNFHAYDLVTNETSVLVLPITQNIVTTEICGRRDALAWVEYDTAYLAQVDARLAVADLQMTPPEDSYDLLTSLVCVGRQPLLLTGSKSGFLKVFERGPATLLNRVQSLDLHKKPIYAIATDGYTVLSGASDRLIKVWNLEGAGSAKTLNHHIAGVSSIVMHPAVQRAVYSADSQGNVLFQDLATKRAVALQGQTKEDQQTPSTENHARGFLAWAEDENYLIHARRHVVQEWDRRAGRILASVQLPGDVTCMDATANMLFLGTTKGACKLTLGLKALAVPGEGG